MKNLLMLCLLTVTISVSAQSNFTTIYNIFQTKCISCHGGATPQGGLNLTGTETDVYNRIVEVAPNNATAVAKGDMRIDKGYPERSFLLRKVAHGLSSDLELTAGEGNAMPNGQTKLPDHEIELIRQWILYDAKQTGNDVNYQRLIDYYTTGGRPKIIQPTPPAAGQGFQVHFGPVFWAPNEEKEFFKKHDPKIPQDLEVYRIEVVMNAESHHYILRRFTGNSQDNWIDGLVPFTFNAFSSGKDFLNAWQSPDDLELPLGTGFFWDQNTVLDLNYHLKNYHSEIMPGEVYMNVYTRPRSTATVEMKAELIPNLAIFIPNNNQVITISDRVTRSGQTWNIWMLASHTHKYGIDYDIFQSNSNGSKGNQLYEGFYDFDYTFNQGFYDWSHPPIRRFSPLVPVNMSNGLIHEAKWRNNGPNSVTWGFTTNEEMMLIYVQYTTQSVNYKPPIVASNVGSACDPVELSTDGGLSAYQWSNGETTSSITVTVSGTYTVTVTDGSGSTYTSDPYPVTLNIPQASINNGLSSDFCNGQTTALNASGATSYLWSTGATSQSIQVNSAGTYAVTITDGNGCTASASTVVSVQAGPSVQLGNTAFCAGQNTTLDAGNPGLTFLWSTGASTQTITIVNSGTYTVTVTDGSGCANSATSTVTVHALPNVNLQNVEACAGSNVSFNAGNPGSSYLWSTGASTQSITVNQPDSYSVTVTNSNGCVNTSQASFIVGSSLVFDFSDEEICEGNAVELDAGFPGSTYNWSTGDATQTITVSNAAVYSVTVEDPNGCSGSADVQVVVLSAPVAEAGDNKVICSGGTVQLTATGGVTYQWSNGMSGNMIIVNQIGSYNVTVTAGNGCTASDKADVSPAIFNTGVIMGETFAATGSTEQYSVNNNGGSTYNWTVTNGTIVSGQGTAVIEVSWNTIGTGMVEVTETTVDACTSDIVSKEVNIGTISVQLFEDEKVTIFPNPFSKATKISFPNARDEAYQLNLYDVTGKTVLFLREITAGEVIIHRGELGAGIYFVELRGEKILRGKVIIAD